MAGCGGSISKARYRYDNLVPCDAACDADERRFTFPTCLSTAACARCASAGPSSPATHAIMVGVNRAPDFRAHLPFPAPEHPILSGWTRGANLAHGERAFAWRHDSRIVTRDSHLLTSRKHFCAGAAPLADQHPTSCTHLPTYRPDYPTPTTALPTTHTHTTYSLHAPPHLHTLP